MQSITSKIGAFEQRVNFATSRIDVLKGKSVKLIGAVDNQQISTSFVKAGLASADFFLICVAI